ncbi:MAG: rhomboid family intramembrane serine protease [Cytophagales bacterium]|nr:rhomboid family intramembrane serine protease [Hyphobacterium sp. CCMP332]
MFQLTPVARNLLIANVAILFLDYILNGVLSNWFALYYVGSDNFAPYQFITYMFFHGGIGHLFGNMLALFFFGPWLERTWGPQRFFIFYMVCGVGAGLLYGIVQTFEMQMLLADINAYKAAADPDLFAAFINEHAPYIYSDLYNFINGFAENPESSSYIEQSKSYLDQIYNRQANIPMVGASGAIFAILLGFGMLFPNTQIFLLFPPIPIKAKYLVTFYGLYEVYALFQNSPTDNVAHLAHIGGMLFAFFFIRKWKNSGNYF